MTDSSPNDMKGGSMGGVPGRAAPHSVPIKRAISFLISVRVRPMVAMGHRSVAFTLTVYGHLLDADLDDLVDRLDALPRDVPRLVHGVAT